MSLPVEKVSIFFSLLFLIKYLISRQISKVNGFIKNSKYFIIKVTYSFRNI